MNYDPFKVALGIALGMHVIAYGYMVAICARVALTDRAPRALRLTVVIMLIAFAVYVYLIGIDAKPGLATLNQHIETTAREQKSLLRTFAAAGINLCVAAALHHIVLIRGVRKP